MRPLSRDTLCRAACTYGACARVPARPQKPGRTASACVCVRLACVRCHAGRWGAPSHPICQTAQPACLVTRACMHAHGTRVHAWHQGWRLWQLTAVSHCPPLPLRSHPAANTAVRLPCWPARRRGRRGGRSWRAACRRRGRRRRCFTRWVLFPSDAFGLSSNHTIPVDTEDCCTLSPAREARQGWAWSSRSRGGC